MNFFNFPLQINTALTDVNEQLATRQDALTAELEALAGRHDALNGKCEAQMSALHERHDQLLRLLLPSVTLVSQWVWVTVVL